VACPGPGHAPLVTEGLRPAQITAIEGIERSLVAQRYSRSLVQMATGAGKTYTAVTTCYRLLKHGGFRRILFLVDRNNLGTQTLAEFQNYATPEDGRRLTEIYNVNALTSAGMLDSSSVVISTIQRVYAALQGRIVEDVDDPGMDAFVPDAPVDVAYNPQMPPESFDLVIVDEAHRSIYGVWRGVLEYFDAHIVGLTATPVKQTFGFFQQNLVSEYTYAQSVADNVNVDFDVYRIRTQISDAGSTIEAGTVVPKVDRRTRVQRYESLDEDVVYTAGQLDRAVTAKSQIRLVLETFRDRLFTEIFPGRSTVPKTLIFCKDDNHAEEVVTAVREVFGQGNDFAAKITYNAKDPKGALKAFRTSPTLRVAVTVDMIATGTDVRPLECVFFMRDVRSASYFEQMKGRWSRTISSTDFQLVTPDATTKDRFVLVDAVGVTEHPHVDATPLERKKSVSMDRLLDKAGMFTLDEDETASLASRLAKLELDLTPAERAELDEVAGGSLRAIVQGLVRAVDLDEQAKAVAARPEDPAAAIQNLVDAALEPLAARPDLRERIKELRRQHDQVIDEVSVDVLLDAGGVVNTDKARSVVTSWRQYLEDHLSRLDAAGAYADSVKKKSSVLVASWSERLIWQRPESRHAVGSLLREKMRNGLSARASASGRVRVLTLTAVTKNSFSAEYTKLIDVESHRASDLWPQGGDILVQRSNTPELVGSAALYEGPDDWAIFPDLLIRLRPDLDAVEPRYLALALRSPRAQRYFRSRAKGLSGAMPKIDQSVISSFKLPLAPMSEQRRVVAIAQDVEQQGLRLGTTVDACVTRGRALRRALLDAAFSGRLTGRSTDTEIVEEIAARQAADLPVPVPVG
jgi:type I site-specific restriction endonuclease